MASTLFDRILVPLDGSPASEAVLHQAERLLCSTKSEIILFHSWNSRSPDFDDTQTLEKYLLALERRLSFGGARQARHLVSGGSVAQSILAATESEKVSLVAMSSHGTGTAPTSPMARTVEGVLQASRVPLFLARSFTPSSSGEPMAARCEPSGINRILLPLDGSTASLAAIPPVREIALLVGAMIVILHVRPDRSRDPAEEAKPAPSGLSPEADRPGDGAPPESLKVAAESFKAAGLETLILDLEGDPVPTILDFARPSAADLIAMSTHGWTGAEKAPVGSVADKVMRHAILPTLLVGSPRPGSGPA
jgi:nucleotide-binding universal stress UspA family protein